MYYRQEQDNIQPAELTLGCGGAGGTSQNLTSLLEGVGGGGG